MPTHVRDRSFWLYVPLALAGTWVAHNLEYLRVWGTPEFPNALSRTAHLYMGPLGLLLLVLAALGVGGTWRLVRRLEHRLVVARSAWKAGRGAGAAGDELPAPPSPLYRWTVLVALLWPVQVALYLVQENLEARSVHLAAPGLGAVTGVHALAPLVHLAVAAVLAAFIWICSRRIAHLVDEIVAALGRFARPIAAPMPAGTARVFTPLERWGRQRWQRPPPRLLVPITST